MNRRWLQGLPSLCMGLLLMAGCQVGQDSPSEPLGRGLEGADRCSDPALNRERTLFPDDVRQRQVQDLCQDILAGRIDADLGADQLHVLAYDGWKAGNLGNATAQDLAEFNAAVRGLAPVAALESDEQPVWNTTNIGNDQFLAVGPTTANGIHCFGSGLNTWCFQVNAGGDSYFFLAEAKPDLPTGTCPGALPNDCENDVIHIDVNPDEAVDDGDNATNVNVWSCTDFASRHARFGVGPDGYGDPGPAAPAQIVTACGLAFELEGIQRWVWAGLKPLRWAAGVGTLNAGGTGTTFARGSDVSEGEQGVPSARDLVCEVTGRYASISEGTRCTLYADATKTAQIASCITARVSQKVGQCTWEDVVVSNPDGLAFSGLPGQAPCLWGTAQKVINPSTSHFAEHTVCVGPGDPLRGETKTFVFDLR